MSRFLLVYNEIPEKVRYFLMPTDHNMIPLFERVNKYYVNLNIDVENGLTEEQVFDINSAYEDIYKYMFDWNNDVDKYEGINPDMLQYQIEPGKLEEEIKLSQILEIGIVL